MIERHYTVRFLTPAFIGDADQIGAWRTPPFKALLRQWWRVAVASDCKFNTETLREREAALFGSASDGASSKSQIRMRLSRWDEGKLKSWDRLDTQKVAHPEVKDRQGVVRPVGAHLYLGFGPLEFRGDTALKKRAAIQPGEDAEFKLAFDTEHAAPLDTALWLMDRYGTLGGRSRNGWGSFTLTPKEGTAAFSAQLDSHLTSDWKQALTLDWPHAIGRSEGLVLIWETAPFADWKGVMRRLAEIKIAMRTGRGFEFTTGRDAPAPEARHWLSYPVTNHSVSGWKERGKGDFRLPNSLRFKVREGADGKLHGVIFHVPCSPTREFRPDRAAIESVWRRVHEFLDAPQQQLQRIES